VCFNAPRTCECDPPFDGRGGIEPTKPWSPVRPPSLEDIDAAVAGVAESRRGLVRDVLIWLVENHCWIEDPPAVVRDYVNIRVPSAYGPARLASMNRSTGRLEFHEDSHDIAIAVGVADLFDRVPSSNAAAITIVDGAGRDAAIRLAEAYLASRRATG
jgi:hypothetical protein